jgi:uncharacterized membrane protein
LIFAKYLWTICHYPIAYLHVVLRNLNYVVSLIADPVETINQFVQLGTPFGRIFPGLSLRNLMMLAHNFSITTFIQMLLEAISTTISAIALLLFVFGIPIIILRKWRAGEPTNDGLAVTGVLWLVFLTMSFAFSMVHIEPRHVLPVLPAALVCVVYTLQWIRAGLRRRASIVF